MKPLLPDDPSRGLSRGAMILAACRDSLTQLAPQKQYRNAATFGLFISSICVTLFGIVMLLVAPRSAVFALLMATWLWLSVLLANFADAVILQQAKARAAALGSTGRQRLAKRLLGTQRNEYQLVDAATLRRGQLVLVEANDIIPADGTVIEGTASVSEAAVTGESAPVLRATGPHLSSVRSGAQVLSDWLVLRVTCREGSFFDPIVTTSELTARSRTAPEIALSLLLVATTIAFLLGVALHFPASTTGLGGALGVSALVALLVCCLPIATGASVSAIGIVSLARLRRANVIALSGGSLEAATDIDVLVLDKTGTITRGDRRAVAFRAVPSIAERDLLKVAQLASLADATPEGRSIVELVTQMTDQPLQDLSDAAPVFHDFTAQTRISGVDVDGRKLRKGAADSVRRFVEQAGGAWPAAVTELVEGVARAGSTPLVVADGPRVLGVIDLQDVVKSDMRGYCATLRRMGIKTIMVTGDNPLTAAAIAAEVGVDSVLAEATPERKYEFIRQCQQEGHRVAMYGDGANDAPALAQADFAVAMHSGTQVAKEAGDLVDLDSNPTKFIAIVEGATQMLRTRRSLTTFSVAADLAKYLSIIPAVFAATYPALKVLNVLRLTSARSAIVSALVFNLLIIGPLLLLSIRAVGARARSGVFRFSLWIYGLFGFLLSWVGIKLTHIGLTALGVV
jgi:potassium-transporting ATPase ATP-binding subunit